MSPYFLRPLETLFWCPAECQNQSRGPSFLRSHRDFLINYNHQQLVCSRFFLLQPHTTSGRNFFFAPFHLFFSHWEKAFTTIIQRWPLSTSHLGFGQPWNPIRKWTQMFAAGSSSKLFCTEGGQPFLKLERWWIESKIQTDSSLFSFHSIAHLQSKCSIDPVCILEQRNVPYCFSNVCGGSHNEMSKFYIVVSGETNSLAARATHFKCWIGPRTLDYS